MPSPPSDGSKSSSAEWADSDSNGEKDTPGKQKTDDASDSWGESEGEKSRKQADESESWESEGGKSHKQAGEVGDGDSWGSEADEGRHEKTKKQVSLKSDEWSDGSGAKEKADKSDEWSDGSAEKDAVKKVASLQSDEWSEGSAVKEVNMPDAPGDAGTAAVDEEGLRAAASAGDEGVDGAATESLTIHAVSVDTGEGEAEGESRRPSFLTSMSSDFDVDKREGRLYRCVSALKGAMRRLKLKLVRFYRRWRRLLLPMLIFVAIVFLPFTCLWCCCCPRLCEVNEGDEESDLETGRSGSSTGRDSGPSSASAMDEDDRPRRSSLKKMTLLRGEVGFVNEHSEAIKKVHMRVRRESAREVMDTLGGTTGGGFSPKSSGSPRGGSPRGSISPRGTGSPRGGDASPKSGRKTRMTPGSGRATVTPGSGRGRAHATFSGGSPTPRDGSATPKSPKPGSPTSGGSSSRNKRRQRVQDLKMNSAKRKPKKNAGDKAKKYKRRCSLAAFAAYYNSFQQWMEDRDIYYRDTWILVCDMLAEDEWDYDHLDEFGNATKVVHWIPVSLRSRWNFFLIMYWDPFVDSLDKLPSCRWIFLLLIRTTPSLSFMASLAWLGISIYGNMQYNQGDCIVEKLPERFDNDGNVVARVEGVYLVERSFPPTPLRPEGVVLQECVAKVLCDRVDFGDSSGKDDDRCVSFESWSWGDKIECYYHKDDLYGTKGEQLYCLGPPYPLFTKIFTVIVAGTMLLLALGLSCLISWRGYDLKRQEALASIEAAEQMKEVEEAKRAIEEREAEEAEKQRKRMRGEVDESEEDLSVDEDDAGPGFDVDAEGDGNDDGEGE